MSEYRIRIVAAAFALMYFMYIVSKLRRQQLTVSRSLLWLLSGALLLGLTIYPEPLGLISHWAGFEVATNAVFVLWLLILTTVMFTQTLALSRYDDQLRRLAQDYALLRASLRSEGTEE